MKIKDRIKELRRVKASELAPNPKNWRTHPDGQKDALKGVLAEVGWAGAAIARELEDGTLQLIDGHLRAETVPDGDIPVLILDVTEAEADMILATLDPLAGMAEADSDVLGKLLAGLDVGSDAVQGLLDGLAEENGSFTEVEEGELPNLPDGDREPFQQMTFTVHDSQVEPIKSALADAKNAGPFVGPNENSNGNALARIAEAYLGTG